MKTRVSFGKGDTCMTLNHCPDIQNWYKTHLTKRVGFGKYTYCCHIYSTLPATFLCSRYYSYFAIITCTLWYHMHTVI